MAISQMKRLSVFAHKSDADRLVRKLMNARCVSVSVMPVDEEAGIMRFPCEEERADRERRVGRIEEALPVLTKYSQRKRSFARPQHEVDRQAFAAGSDSKEAWQTVDDTVAVQSRLNEIRMEKAKTEALIASLHPWERDDLPLSVTETAKTILTRGALPTSVDFSAFQEKLIAAGGYAEQASEETSGFYLSVVCMREDEEAVGHILTENGFLRITFKDIYTSAAEAVEANRKKLTDLASEEAQLLDRTMALANDLDRVEILYDIENTSLIAAQNKCKLASTGTCVLLDGWVPSPAEEKVTAILSAFECAYEFEEPAADAQEENAPPVLLRNNSFAGNFEWVIGMYSYPKYGRFDPTFIMSIFYCIIFGLMFADVGYGLILVLGGFLGVKILKPQKSMKTFLTMFGYCGISCMVMGVLFGGWFSDLPIVIARTFFGVDLSGGFFSGLILNPMDDLMGYLYISIAVGAVHIITGMAIKFYILCKDGHFSHAVSDVGAYWVLFAGVVVMVLGAMVPGVILIALGAGIIVLFHGHDAKNFGGRIATGLSGLYDLISYGSDLLSYSRILALGLASAVIGQVVNMLGTMTGGGVLGAIMLILVGLLGHTLNFALNVLGTFVHTSRLQYVEFFNKFYEDGGVPFVPEEPSDKYTLAEI